MEHLRDNWTVLQTRRLIAIYKAFPNLWDCNHKYYKNKTLRRSCLKNIAKKLSQFRNGTTIDDVRAKLKTLRSQFGKEKRRREFIETKRGLDEYQPKLWCYEELKFIDVEKREDNEERSDGNNSQDETAADVTAGEDAMIEQLLKVENERHWSEATVEQSRTPRYEPWTKEQTFTLLMLLKRNPILYDKTHPLYTNHFYRSKGFRDMLAKVQLCRPIATIPDMRAKLKTLRSQYLKEKRMQKVTTEHRGRVRYIPKLWCFEHLKFLDEPGKYVEEEQEMVESPQENEFEVGEQPDDCYIGENENEIYVKSFDDSEMEEIDPTPATPVNGDIPRGVLHQKCLSLVESLTKQMEREQESSHHQEEEMKTPQALLGRMVEVELLKVSNDIFEETKWKIIKILEEASKKNRDSKMHRQRNGR